jgi:hypothetical protein
MMDCEPEAQLVEIDVGVFLVDTVASGENRMGDNARAADQWRGRTNGTSQLLEKLLPAIEACTRHDKASYNILFLPAKVPQPRVSAASFKSRLILRYTILQRQ